MSPTQRRSLVSSVCGLLMLSCVQGAQPTTPQQPPPRTILVETPSALAACNDDDCARAALAGTPFAEAYAATLPGFLAKQWAEHATQARSGIEMARAAMVRRSGRS